MPVSLYQAVSGANNAGTLATLDPQPRNNADLGYPEFLVGGDGTVVPQGSLFAELEFNFITYAQRTTVLAAFGLSETVFSHACTVRLHTNADAWANYNAIASHTTGTTRAEPGAGGWEDLKITVSRLVAI